MGVPKVIDREAPGVAADFSRNVRDAAAWGSGGFTNIIVSDAVDTLPLPDTAVSAATSVILAEISFIGVGGIVRLDFNAWTKITAGAPGTPPQEFGQFQYEIDGSTPVFLSPAAILSYRPVANEILPLAWTDIFQTIRELRYTVRMMSWYIVGPGANTVDINNARIFASGNIAQIS